MTDNGGQHGHQYQGNIQEIPKQNANEVLLSDMR